MCCSMLIQPAADISQNNSVRDGGPCGVRPDAAEMLSGYIAPEPCTARFTPHIFSREQVNGSEMEASVCG